MNYPTRVAHAVPSHGDRTSDGAEGRVSHGPAVLEVRSLSTRFPAEGGAIHAVDNVTFDLARGERLGLVGESGCGKSMTALSIVRLVPPPGRTVAGEVMLDGVDVLRLPHEEMRQVRGGKIGFIFQDPMSSLNPTRTIGFQIAESAHIHLGLNRRSASARAAELLSMVGIPAARDRLDDYPHQFSGGMRQRVMIAIALAGNPQILLADEPTTALDVTVQAQILELLATLSSELGTAVLLITHDLGIAAGMCDRISVMYAGQVVETGVTDDVFEHPEMPYTKGLLDSIPRSDIRRGALLRTIDGSPPDLKDPASVCRFSPRCEYVRADCRAEEPALRLRANPGHMARCFGTEEGGWIHGL